MNETQRQAYLRVMGIQPYYPREPVAGAKPSPRYEFPVPDEPKVIASATLRQPEADTIQAPRRTQRARAVAAKLESSPAPESPVANAAAKPAGAVAASDTASSELRFRLHYYRISETLAAINEVPFEQDRTDAGATATLLKGILTAIGEVNLPEVQGVETFNWPLAAGMMMKNDPVKEARHALKGYIKMRQQTDGFTHLLVFAGQVAELLSADDVDSGRDRLAGSGSCEITVTHSLQAMLAHPILKREVWSQLQPLRRRLANITT